MLLSVVDAGVVVVEVFFVLRVERLRVAVVVDAGVVVVAVFFVLRVERLRVVVVVDAGRKFLWWCFV